MQTHGGVSRYVARLAEALADRADVVPRIVAPFHVNRHLDDAPARLVLGRRVPDGRWAGRAARAVSRLATPPLLRAFDPDIVHESYYWPRRTAPRRARLVVTVYDLIHEKHPESFPADDPASVNKRAAVERADLVLCISESTRADLVALYPAAAAKARVTLLGFDPPPAGVAPRRRERPYLLFVGARGGYKNFAGLLDAYAESAALRGGFDVAAVGGGPFDTDETAAIARHGLAGRVTQHAADDRALAGWYAGAAAFVYPSLYEGFGIPPLEAMAARVPVVAMRASSVPEVCGDAAEYADPEDVPSLGAAIEAVVLSSDRAATLVAAGTARLERFSWTRCAADTVAGYRTLL